MQYTKALIIVYGKAMRSSANPSVEGDANTILLWSSRLERALEVTERVLKERAFGLELEGFWAANADVFFPLGAENAQVSVGP